MDITKINEYKQNLEALPFDCYELTASITPTTRNDKPALDIELTSMYEPPVWKGDGGLVGLMQALEKATETNRSTIEDIVSHGGCETCD